MQRSTISPVGDIISVMEFLAEPDVKVEIENSQVIFLPPIFKLVETIDPIEYVDATGDYDLCLSRDGKYFHFYNRTNKTEKFAFRFFSVLRFANKGIR